MGAERRRLPKRFMCEDNVRFSVRLSTILAALGLAPLLAFAQGQAPANAATATSASATASAAPNATASPLSLQIEDLKQAALELNRDLILLEEELLFPASTQVAVFVSMDVGTYFKLDAVKLKIGDKLVASHVYTEKQNSALNRGGIQRLYLGNLKSGEHEVTAFFTGYGPNKVEYKRAASFTLNKQTKPSMLEVRVRDSAERLQPQFDFKEWQL